MKRFILSCFGVFASISAWADPITVIFWNDDWDNNTRGFYTIDKDANDTYYISSTQNLPSQVEIHCWDGAYVDKDGNEYTIHGLTSLGNSNVVKKVFFNGADENFTINQSALSGLTNLKVLDLSSSKMAPFTSLILPSTVEYVRKDSYDETSSSFPEGWNVVDNLPTWYTGVAPYEHDRCYYDIQYVDGELKATLVGFKRESYYGHNKERKVGNFTIYGYNESVDIYLSSIDIDENINELTSFETVCLAGYFDSETLKGFASLNQYCRNLGLRNYYTWQNANQPASGLSNVVQFCDTVWYDDSQYKVMTIERDNNIVEHYYKPKAVVGVCDGFPCNGGLIVLGGEVNSVTHITELMTLGANKDIESISVQVKQEATVDDDAFNGMDKLKAVRFIAEYYYSESNEYISDPVIIPNVAGINFIVPADDKKLRYQNNDNVFADADVPGSDNINNVLSYSDITIDEAQLEINLDNIVDENTVLDIPSFYFYKGFGIPVRSMYYEGDDTRKITRVNFSKDFMIGEISLPDGIYIVDLSNVDISNNSRVQYIDLEQVSIAIISESDFQTMGEGEGKWRFQNMSEKCRIVTSLPVVELSEKDFLNLAKDIQLGLYPNDVYELKLTENVHVNYSFDSIELKDGWTFDGQGYSIHCYFLGDDSEYSPIFSSVGNGSTLKNIFFSGGFSGDLQKSEFTYCSPFIVSNYGTIDRCVFNGVNATFTISDNQIVGLVAAENKGTIQNCVVINSYLDVASSNAIGGAALFAGKNDGGETRDCYVVASNITVPQSASNVGLFVGNNDTQINTFIVEGESEGLPKIEQSRIKRVGDNTETINREEVETYIMDVSSAIGKSDGMSLVEVMSDPSAWTYISEQMFRKYEGKLRGFMLNTNSQSDVQTSALSLPIPNMMDVETNLEMVEVDGNERLVAMLNVKNETNMSEAAMLIDANYDLYKDAFVTICNDIQYDAKDINVIAKGENKVDDYMENWITLGTDQKPFIGTFDGQGFSIANAVTSCYDGQGLFGTIGEGGVIKNISVVNTAVVGGGHIDVDKMPKSADGKSVELGILADKCDGSIDNVLFSGALYVDEQLAEDLAQKGLDIEWTPVSGTMSNTNSSISNSLFYITNLEEVEASVADGSNKRNIVIMQNLGVGRNAGQTQKVCNNKKNKKSLSATVGSDVNNDYREYTDEEMASGEPAYWLNFEGKGYTGTYSRKWSKGKMHPIMATSLSAPAVKIVYDIDGVSESEAGLVNPTFFANEDDEVEINVTMAPDKVWVGNGTPELNSATRINRKLLSSACENGIVTVHLKYSATAIGNTNSSAETVITAKGQSVVISGAEGLNYSIVDLKGQSVASGTVASTTKTVILPSAGIYIVNVGNMAKKLVVR